MNSFWNLVTILGKWALILSSVTWLSLAVLIFHCLRPCARVNFPERAKVLVIAALSGVLGYSTFSGARLFGFWKNYRVFMSVKGNFSCSHCKIWTNYIWWCLFMYLATLSAIINSPVLNALQVPLKYHHWIRIKLDGYLNMDRVEYENRTEVKLTHREACEINMEGS